MQGVVEQKEPVGLGHLAGREKAALSQVRRQGAAEV